MYQRTYVSLNQAATAIADRFAIISPATYIDASAAFQQACKELSEALSDGAIRSEGIYFTPMEPDPYQIPSLTVIEHTNPSGKYVTL